MGIPIAKLNQAKVVKASIRGGVRYQVPPFIISNFQSPGINEFLYQLSCFLYKRLLRSGFRSYILGKQHWMRPETSRFPSDFTYSGLLKNNLLMQHLRIDLILEQSLRSWINAPADYQLRLRKTTCS